jgi:hypothetical protein
MRNSILALSFLAISIPAQANFVCQSIDGNSRTRIELLSTGEPNRFQMKTSKNSEMKSWFGSSSKTSEEVSQAMNCEFQSPGVVCSLSILKVRFSKNQDNSLFTISQGFEIPEKPELKDSSGLSFGNNFECRDGE